MATVSLEARLVDITTLAVDAIVNAANEQLAPGGGVCGAIHRAAGPELARACAQLRPCPTGQARLTPGFLLPSKYVIHAVGPVWSGGTRGEEALLASAYRTSLELAESHNCQSIALPALSTGAYRYPLDAAARTAVQVARDFLTTLDANASLHLIRFALFSADALQAFQNAIDENPGRGSSH